MHIDSFLKYLKFEKRYSANTIIAYSNDLAQFKSFVDSETSGISIENVNRNIIRSWIVSLASEKKTSARSIQRKTTCLRSFYKYLMREGIVQKNPTIGITPPKTEKKLPVFLTQSQTDYFVEESFFTADFSGARDRAIIEMLYNTGMRLSEAAQLKHIDIDLNSNTLKVLGKRNKERIIPFNNYLREIINKYITKKSELEMSVSGEDKFFVTDKGLPVYVKFIYRKVRFYLGLVSTNKKKSPHVLRHTFATHMLNNGADLNAIKELLGHANLAATQVYTHSSFEKLKEIYKQAHPRA